MAILPLQLARVSNLLRADLATQAMAQTQQQLLEVQNELSTGKRVNAPIAERVIGYLVAGDAPAGLHRVYYNIGVGGVLQQVLGLGDHPG